MPTVIRRNVSRTVQIAEAIRSSLRYGWATLPVIAAYVVVVSTTLMWFEPAPVARYYRTVSKLDVMPGEEVFIRTDVTRSKGGCDSLVTREWTDGDGKLIVRSQSPIKDLPAGREVYEHPATIPTLAEPGNVWLHTIVEFKCNTVQRVLSGTKFTLPDILFNVQSATTLRKSSQQAKSDLEHFAGSYP